MGNRPKWQPPWLAVVAIPALAIAAGTVRAQTAASYPSKPIRLIAPFAPGGGASIVARLLSEPLTEAWKQSVVVDNRAGAAGTIGTEMAARSAPDGYTLVMATASTVVVNPLFAKVPFDPVRDFAPVARTTTVPLVLVVPAAIPAKSVKELIALATSRAGGLSYASSGEGSISHLAGELFKSATGVGMVHVPYKGGGQALIDIIAGHVQTGFVNVLEALPNVRSGRLRGLGRDEPGALAGDPGHSDGGGKRRRGLFGDPVERGARAGRHAARHRNETEWRDPAHTQSPGPARAPNRERGGTRQRHARGIRRFYQGGNRQIRGGCEDRAAARETVNRKRSKITLPKKPPSFRRTPESRIALSRH